MVSPIPPSAKPFVAVPITATAKATPTTVLTASRGPRVGGVLTDLVAANRNAIGSTGNVQCFIGIRKQGDTGSTWEELWCPVLDDGDALAWPGGELYLSELDELVCYADDGTSITLTPTYAESR